MRLVDSTLVATHNSATRISSENRVKRSISESFLVQVASRFIQCQNTTISEQLEMGVNCLDLRIGKDSVSISHQVPLISLANVLQQINLFLLKHPDRVLIIQVKEDWPHRKSVDWRVVAAVFSDTLNSVIHNSSLGGHDEFNKATRLEIQSLLRMGQILLLTPRGNDCIPGSFVNTLERWYEVSETADLQTRLETDVEKSPSTLTYLPCFLTPTPFQIVSSILLFGPSLEGMSSIAFQTLNGIIKRRCEQDPSSDQMKGKMIALDYLDGEKMNRLKSLIRLIL